ncbi:MAG: hypothetical protein R3F30_04290 [Planctomycetota bacterium]
MRAERVLAGGEERGGRLEPAHGLVEQRGPRGVDVRRVGAQRVEGLARDRRPVAALAPGDRGRAQARSVGATARGRRRDVAGDDGEVGPLEREADRDAARAGARLEHAGPLGQGGQRPLDEELGLGARDQDVGTDREAPAPELLPAEHVGQRLAAEQAAEAAAEQAALVRAQRPLVLEQEREPVDAEDVGEAERQGRARAAELLQARSSRREEDLADGPTRPTQRRQPLRLSA